MQHLYYFAGVAELADAPDLGSGVFDVQVQVLSPAPKTGSMATLGPFFLYTLKLTSVKNRSQFFYLLLSFTTHKVSCTTFVADLKSSASAGKTSAVYCCTTAGASTVTAVLLYFCPGYG